MSKWSKSKKKDKLLEQRRAYAKINSRGAREATKHKDSLRYHFAKECYELSKKKALSPKGMTWDSVFERHWGTPLGVYVRAEQQRQKERQLDHSKLVDQSSPLP
jgi:hypothetical protein